MAKAVDKSASKAVAESTAPPKYLTQTSPGTGKRSRTRGENRAEQIIKTAEQLFHERGYDATSMDDLAQAVGILKGSLYYYVNSKEDLLFRIVEKVHRAVDEFLDEVGEMSDIEPIDRIIRYVRMQLTYNTTNLAELAVYYHEWKRLEGDRLAQVTKERHGHELRVRKLIEQAQAAGQISTDIDARLMVAHIFAVIIWPYTWFRSGGQFSASALVDSAVRFVAGGISLNH